MTQGTSKHSSIRGAASGGRLLNRLMWRIGVALALVVVLLTIITVVTSLADAQQDARQVNQAALTVMADRTAFEIEQLNTSIANVGGSATTRDYGLAISNFALTQSETFEVAVQQTEQALLRSFDDLIQQGGQRIQRVRYISRDGLVWAQVTRTGNDVALERRAGDRVFDAPGLFDAFLRGRPGEVFISEVTPQNTLFAYVPVAQNTSANAIGVIQVQVDMVPLAEDIAQILEDPIVAQEGRRVLVLDATGQLLIDTSDGANLDAGLLDFVQRNRAGLNAASYDGLVVSSAPLTSVIGVGTPWQVIVIDDEGDILAGTISRLVAITAIYLALFAGALVLMRFMLLPLLQPVMTLSQQARGLLSEPAPTDGPPDELETLTQAVGTVAHRLESLDEALKQQAARRQRDLELVARVGRGVATVYDVDTLFNRAINLIVEELGFYHAQVFLVDDAGVNAVLAYSRGKAGQQLLADGFSLPVGSKTVIGTASATGKPVIVNDTQRQDGPHRVNPVLKDTRAELGLPLMSREMVVGVLDIQSTKPDVFFDEDLPVYTLLADQLAIALENARLINETDERLQQIDTLNRQLTRDAWSEVEQQVQLDKAYQYNLLDVSPVDPQANGHSDAPGHLASEIVIRGQVIGELRADLLDGLPFSEGDRSLLEAVTNRVSLAIENARLFQETQTSLTETSTLYQLSRYLNESSTLADIIQAVIVSVMPEANGGQVWMFDEVARGVQPEWMTMVADVAMTRRPEANQNIEGLRLHLADHSFLSRLTSEGVTLVNNINEDARIDSGLRLVFRRLEAQALVIVPLVVRSRWRGLLTMTYAAARQFNRRETRIFTALSDQAGVAIDNRLLLQQTENEVARNENLYAASRIINTAQSTQDLVYAAVATATRTDLAFALSLLEGELDETGWPTSARMIARSADGAVQEVDQVHSFVIPVDSPMREREPEVVLDVIPSRQTTNPRLRWVRSLDYRFLASFPLFSANQPIALFHVFSNRPEPLDASEVEVYRALTGQMSSQLQIRNLLERTERALDETRRLYVASRAIMESADLAAIYSAAVEHLAGPFVQMQGQRITIALLAAWPYATPDAPYMEQVNLWRSSAGDVTPPEAERRLPSDQAPYGRLTANADSALVVPDLTGDAANQLAAAPDLRETLVEQGVASLAVSPIRYRDHWFGAVVVESDHEAAFDAQYARFMMAVADQVAIALDNLRLVDESRFEAERAQAEAQRALALAEAAQLSNRIGGDDIAQGLDEVFYQVARASRFDRWLLVRVAEDDPEMLRVMVARAPGMAVGDDIRYSRDLPMPLTDAVRINRTLLINDVTTYPALRDNPEMCEMIGGLWGRHVVTPVQIGGQILGAILMGRVEEAGDLDERDQQLVETLATQVAVTLENRRLFNQTQAEQRNLRAILETLPVGMLVLDPATLMPMQFNQQAQDLLGQEIDPTAPFSIEQYRLCRTGTDEPYPLEEMPIFLAQEMGIEAMTDDVAVMLPGRTVDLLVTAAPITDPDGTVRSIVVAFQDISSLRNLENTLQENLRETVLLYEAQRQLVEADTLLDVMEVAMSNLALQEPADAHFIVADALGRTYVARSLVQPLSDPAMLDRVLDPQEMEVVRRVQQDERVPADLREELAPLDATALLTVPLNISTRSEPYGWLVFISDQPEGIQPDQERVIMQLRDAVATAIDNRLLIESQEAALSEVRDLYNATRAISQARDLEQLSDSLREVLMQFEKPDFVFAYVSEEAGLQSGQTVLVDYRGPLAQPVDFIAILGDYDIPPGGVYINDIGRLTELLEPEEVLAARGVRAFAAIHLRPKDQIGGMIVLAYRTPHPFTDTEDRYLNTLADGASVVLNSFILFEQIQSALEETSTLYQASRALSDATSPEDILDVVVNYLIAPHVDHVFIALLEGRSWDSAGAMVKVVARWSLDESIDLQGVTLTRDQFPAWDQLAAQSVLIVDDVEADTILDDMARIGIQSLDARSLIIVPLRVSTRAIGAVWLGSRQPYQHDDRELRTYQAFAEQASLSIEAAFLLQQTERRARQLQISAEVSQTATQILDLEELMPQLVDIIKEAFGYDHTQIFLMDELDEWAVLRASTGEPGRQLLAVQHRLAKGSDSVIGMVTATGRPQIALDTADADVVHRPNPYLPLTRSEMALPLTIKGRVVGALDVQSNQPNAFNEEDVKALTTLAAQISVAIDNANLYESAQQQASQMSFLFEITSAAAAADSLEEGLGEVAELIQGMLEAAAVAIYLPRTFVDERDPTRQYVHLTPMAAAGIAQPLSEIEAVDLADSTHLLAEIGRDLKPFLLRNIADEPRYLPVASDAQSAVVVPLTSVGKLIGIIALEDSRVAAYGYDTLQLLLTLSGSLSAIIQSSQLLLELQRTNEQLLEVDRIKSDFLANMSHELRTPLNSIIGFSRVMLKGIDGPLTEMQEQDLTTIFNSGQHLLSLINEILDQAKIAANKMELKLDYFPVKPLVEAVKSIGIGLLKDKPVDMRLDVSPGVDKVYGDELRTRQILLNLVSNAAKFTNEGAVTVRVYPVQTETGLAMVQIDVEDTGIGIAEADMPLLFEAFRQVDSSLTRTQGGTGLGLPIAKSLAEMQGGEMLVQSEVNVGSMFSITIPVAPTETTEAESAALDAAAPQVAAVAVAHDDDDIEGLDVDTGGFISARPTAPDKAETRPTRRPTRELKRVTGSHQRVQQARREVLLIEDDKDMVDQFRRILQRDGFEVQTGDHPAYAEAMASNLRPNVIVMDVNFANGEGWNVLTRLKDRDDTFDIPVVVVTLSDDSERAFRLGAHGFIQRPFDPDALVAAAREAEQESNKERILIIDDQEADARLLTQLLNQNGTYRVFSAADGQEGISMVARRRPDLIILDLRMPEMDGFAVLNELRANPETQNIPVLVVTGEVDLKSDEKRMLDNVRVLHKAGISEEAYQAFIQDVESHLKNRE